MRLADSVAHGHALGHALVCLESFQHHGNNSELTKTLIFIEGLSLGASSRGDGESSNAGTGRVPDRVDDSGSLRLDSRALFGL